MLPLNRTGTAMDQMVEIPGFPHFATDQRGEVATGWWFQKSLGINRHILR